MKVSKWLSKMKKTDLIVRQLGLQDSSKRSGIKMQGISRIIENAETTDEIWLV